MSLFTSALALVALLAAPSPAGATKVSLASTGHDGAYHVTGEFSVTAPASAVWEVVTDYDGLASFVSAIKSSRVLQRGAGRATIEQVGSGSFLFISRSVRLTLAVQEDPPLRLSFHEVNGSQFKRYEGAWRIEPSSGGCLVAYDLTAEPVPELGPRFAAKSVLRKNAKRLLEEVRMEIERRVREASHAG